ncbi:MAG: serine/threonine protein kinase [Akkermansia sp.]|nr:serine/threonine protein kinase [Akkermansia sp.]
MSNESTIVNLPSGTRLEKYEITCVLGQGGCGISYKAIDLQLEREVVLKEHFPLGLCRRLPGTAEVTPTDDIAYERSLQSFCREARILAGLRHAGIVPIHELFAACGTAFLVMDYVEGINLRAWLAGKPSRTRIRKALLSILEALEYMHSAGVIHRDIKPENLIIQNNDSGVIIDFGAALLGTPTHTLTLVGTPAFAAPEQFMPEQLPDARTDIYSLGRSFLRVAEESGTRLPYLVAKSLKTATHQNPAGRFRNAAAWIKALDSRRYKRLLLYTLIFIKLCVIIFAWIRRAERTAGMQPTSSTQPVQATPRKALVTDTRSPYYGLPVGAPLHPTQLVHYDKETCDFIRYSKAELAPREEEFLQKILTAQQEMNRKYDEEDKRLKSDPDHAHKINWVLYKLQTKLNDLVIQEIHSYLNKYYPDGDPYASLTALLISDISNLRVNLIRPLLKIEYEPIE